MMKQNIVYEGIDSLCFQCGKIGHKKELCQDSLMTEVRNSALSVENNGGSDPTPSAIKSSISMREKDEFGLWMLVQRRKPKGKPTVAEIRNKNKKIFIKIMGQNKENDSCSSNPRL
ncbi:hypothetical protein REPUB_Repub17cG0073100 [Reevesia pubescens]